MDELLKTVRNMSLNSLRSDISIFNKYGVPVPTVLDDEYKFRMEELNKMNDTGDEVKIMTFESEPTLGFESFLQNWIREHEVNGYRCVNETFSVYDWKTEKAKVDVYFRKN